MAKETDLPELDFALNHQREYGTQLLKVVASERPMVYKVWSLLRDSGFVSEDNLIFDTTSYQGERSESSISVGLLPIPEERKNRIFKNEFFTKEDIILYKFTHELSHRLVDMLIGDRSSLKKVPKSLLNVLATFKSVREQGFGFTNRQELDNEDQMQTEDIMKKRAEEDMVDYITMLLWDENYLNEYLDYLSDENNAETRKSDKLMTLNPQLVNYFGKIRTLVLTSLG